jgi:predicted DNA-binding transcriptional regulator YafY
MSFTLQADSLEELHDLAKKFVETFGNLHDESDDNDDEAEPSLQWNIINNGGAFEDVLNRAVENHRMVRFLYHGENATQAGEERFVFPRKIWRATRVATPQQSRLYINGYDEARREARTFIVNGMYDLCILEPKEDNE